MLIILSGVFVPISVKQPQSITGFLLSKTINKVRLYIQYILFLLFLVDHEKIHNGLDFYLIQLKKHH